MAACIDMQELSSILTRYPPEQRYILAIMQDIQGEYKYLPKTGLQMISDYVDAPLSRIYSMATFYKAFSLVPKGRINFKVCDGTACHIKGSSIIMDQIDKYLNIKPGETTADQEFSMETVNCLGACALAPVVVANEKVHPKVTSSGIIEIIKVYGGPNDAADN